MKNKRKIKELNYDLNRSRKSILRLISTNNKILNVLFSSISADEKNNKIGWLLINNKIDETEKSFK